MPRIYPRTSLSKKIRHCSQGKQEEQEEANYD
jgi:hypothetical protein